MNCGGVIADIEFLVEDRLLSDELVDDEWFHWNSLNSPIGPLLFSSPLALYIFHL